MSPVYNSYYIVLVCIVLPIVLILLMLCGLYLLYTRRLKLNWYDRTLLEESSHEQATTFIRISDDTGSVRTLGGEREKTGLCARNRNCNRKFECAGGGGRTGSGSVFCGLRRPSSAIMEVIKSLKKLSTRWKSSSAADYGLAAADENGKDADWIICSKRQNGSSPGSPTNEPMDQGTFWVPPTVVERKRAQSLVPSTQRTDSDEDQSSGTTTPASTTGTREFSYSFPSAPNITDVTAISATHGNRQRRASMQDAIDFRKIDSKLYDRRLLQRQQSVASIEEEHLGSIHFNMNYNKETSLLTVHLAEAENLVSRDFSGTADPYCKLCLAPGRRTYLQSKVHRKTTNPVFDEEFIFEIPEVEDLCDQTLEMLVYDYDQFSRHECIGQVKVPLVSVDLSQHQSLWKPICHADEMKIKEFESGEIIFSLGYLSSAERLTIVIMKARNLRHCEEGKITMDPYVKVAVHYSNGKKVKKKKSSTKHNVLTPVWNEALTFSLPKDHLQSSILDIAVLHDNKIGNDEILGRTKISRDSDGDERLHWEEMVSGRNAVARWHKLK